MKRGQLKRRPRKKMAAREQELATQFRETVRAKQPVIVHADPRRRTTIVDAHHVLPFSWLKTDFWTLEPEERWERLWDADNGVPVERARHDEITVAFKRIQPEELRPENFDFAERHDLMWLLHRECPGLLVEHA